MTKNNLREHLNWLLSLNSALPARPASYRNAAQSGTIVETQTDVSSHSIPIDPLLLNLSTVEGSGSTPGCFQSPFPPSTAGSNDAMARLQLPAKAKTKSRLLSENVSSSLQTPQSSKRTPGRSLTNSYNTHYDQRTNGKSSDLVILNTI